jgi:sugar phosphate isomerase/epimerase
MRQINPKDIYVSVVDRKKKDELLSYDLQHNLEIANFYQPKVLDGDWKKDADAFLHLVRSNGKECSLHGPMIDMNYHSRDPKIRKVVSQRYHQIFHIAEELSAKFIVVHSSYNPMEAQASKQEKWVKAASDFFPPFVEKAKQLGLTLLIENIFDPEPEPIITLVRKIDSPNFKVCLDVGHWYLFSKQSIKNWIEIIGNELAYFHLHDNDGVYDEHAALGRGKIPFKDLFEALDQSPAEPKYCIEVRSVDAIKESLEYLKQNKFISNEIS